LEQFRHEEIARQECIRAEDLQKQAEREARERDERAWRMKVEEELDIRYRSNAARAKMFADALRSAAIRMGNDPMDVIPFFENIQHLLVNLKVPDNLRVDLMRSYLSERAVVSQLDTAKAQEYVAVKRYILSQLRLTPRTFLENFNTNSRLPEETAVLFASRLKTLLQYYLDGQNVKDLTQLFSLLVCDWL
jgi:hypothetical protein